MNEMEAIVARHSVRAYTGEPIKPDALAELNQLIDEINAEHNLHIQLMEGTEGMFTGMVKAFCGWENIPAYLAMIGPDTPQLDELCGWCGEKIVLRAQMLGLNTCWAGMFKKKNVKATINPGEKLCLVIAIGYGVTQGKERSSKPYSAVANAREDAPEWFKQGVEYALLAPTAVNQQKFCFHLAEDDTVTMSTGKGPFSTLDMGIARYHFELASGHKVTL